MADHNTTTSDDLEGDPRIQRLLGYLMDGPMPTPPAEAVQRAKALGARAASPRPGVMQHAAEFIARLIFDSRAAPALAGFRGGPAEAHLIYTSEAGDIDIQIQPPEPGQQSAPTRIMAQIDTDQRPESARLTRTDDTIIAEVNVDDHGMFTMEAPSSSYDLMIILDQSTVTIPAIEL